MVENPPANAGDAEEAGSIPGLGRSPEKGNGNPFQCSCLKIPMDRGAWRAAVPEVTKESDTHKQQYLKVAKRVDLIKVVFPRKKICYYTWLLFVV